MLKIGTLGLQSNIVLSPLAGISDLPFRLLNRRYGCELAFVEMINARSISYKSQKTKQMLISHSGDRPLGIQLLGRDHYYILMAIEALKKYAFDVLDFNAACPAKKVIRRGEGAALLRDPAELFRILTLIVKNAHVPVTVKIRLGWDQDSMNACDIAQAAQDAGVSAVFIHGRTKSQESRGGVNYQAVHEVKKSLRIPLIAGGDIFSPQLAKKIFDETGCDGVIVARGALGNPWIFKAIEAFLHDGAAMPRPSRDEMVDTIIAHLNAAVDFYGEEIGVMNFRKFFSWYTKGMSNVRLLRERFYRAVTQEQMLLLLEQLRKPSRTRPRVYQACALAGEDTTN